MGRLKAPQIHRRHLQFHRPSHRFLHQRLFHQPNADGSIDVHFGPDSPGAGKNWIKTFPDKGFFVILRLYGPSKAFFDKTWKSGDLQKQ
ncbi:DUF1214 domain-containing protein [Pseudomonas koreensis]|uniref:DUF1214 domain-containing protein n=1 Tax=Pseudomonas koreensis TaxID=198620 RepID=UPI0009ED95A2